MTDRTGSTVCQHGTLTDKHCIMCCDCFPDCNACKVVLKNQCNTKTIKQKVRSETLLKAIEQSIYYAGVAVIQYRKDKRIETLDPTEIVVTHKNKGKLNNDDKKLKEAFSVIKVVSLLAKVNHTDPKAYKDAVRDFVEKYSEEIKNKG